MNITKKLYVTDRTDWRKWLEKNYRTESEIWLIFYKKSSGKPRIPYNDAVEEALCFGWIDSTIKGIDTEKYAQRFSPRRPKSSYSQANKERLRRLTAEGKAIKEVVDMYRKLADENYSVSSDILSAIKENKNAWIYYQKFSDAYKRVRIAFIEGARKRPAEFRKRLRYFISKTSKNKQFGFGGIEKYY